MLENLKSEKMNDNMTNYNNTNENIGKLAIPPRSELTIKVSNSLVETNMGFTALDKNIFFMLCAVLRDEGSGSFTLTFKDIKRTLGVQKMTNEELRKNILSMNEKLIRSVGYVETEKEDIFFTLFTDLRIDRKKWELNGEVNHKYAFLINDLISNYTTSDFLTYLDL